jgi:nitrogen fixation protein NifZ
MLTRWTLGERVRLTRNVRNDGTYTSEATGVVLIRRGSVGAVVDIGIFLQDQIIYAVHFLADDRIVGCREEELIGGDEPWIASAFEAREKVFARKILALGNDHRVPRGAIGEVLRVMCDGGEVLYHVHFDCLPGRTLGVPEAALAGLAEGA